jgi:hypothetical protein
MAMRRRASKSVVAAVVLGLLAIAVGSGWFVQRWRHQQWAQTAIPKIRQLADAEHFVAANALLKEARRYLPDDVELANLSSTVSRSISMDSAPSGARVWYAAYATEPNWQPLGTTPLNTRPSSMLAGTTGPSSGRCHFATRVPTRSPGRTRWPGFAIGPDGPARPPGFWAGFLRDAAPFR